MCGGVFISGCLLTVAHFLGKPVNMWVAIAAATLVVAMLYRFLKFYRLFAVELLRPYAEQAIKKA